MNRIIVTLCLALLAGCDQLPGNNGAVSASGVPRAKAHVETNENGRTTEQENIIERYRRDNLPGSIKHLYIISAYSGDVLLYSTVKGKVTSSGKRLNPTSAFANYAAGNGGYKPLDGGACWTTEMIQDDGTYGSSIEYLFWFDSKGVYHQHYVQGGQIVHISDQALAVPKVIINVEHN